MAGTDCDRTALWNGSNYYNQPRATEKSISWRAPERRQEEQPKFNFDRIHNFSAKGALGAPSKSTSAGSIYTAAARSR
jgi:hypothetical protein